MRIKIKDIKLGQEFYEKGYGPFVALEDAFRKDDGWLVIAQLKDSPSSHYTEFYVADGYEHYGPDLYTEKAYI